MRAAEDLIAEIVASSRIPSRERRRELARELRAHVDDFVLIARAEGHSDDEIERMIAANFGDPLQVGRNFAWVYRRERAVLAFSVFALSTVLTATLITAGTVAVQAGVATGFGVPFLHALGSRHTVIEALDIIATVAAYLGIVSLEKLFDRYAFPKAIALVSIVFAAAGLRLPFLMLGLANALFLRTVQITVKNQTARFAAVVAGFGIFGLLLWARLPGMRYSLTAILASWLIMGAGYQLMTAVAARVDRGLFHKLQQL